MPKGMTPFSVWTIYDCPDDFPHNYVARRAEVVDGEVRLTNQVVLASSLAVVRQHLKQYYGELSRVPRMANDNPAVVETWA